MWPIWVQLGHAYKEAGDITAAEASYRHAVAGDPQDPDAQLQLGRILRLNGRLDEAREALQRSAAIRPSDDAAVELARLTEMAMPGGTSGNSTDRTAGDQARLAQQWFAAARLYRAHLDVYPMDGAIWVQLGNTLKEAGNYPDAEAAYLRAISLDDTAADSYLQLGHLLKLSGARGGAIAAYRKSDALALRDAGPSEAAAEMERMGVFSLGLSASDGGAGRSLSAIFVRDRWTILLEAQAARDTGQWDRSAALYREYLAIESGADRVWHEMSCVLQKTQRYREALEALDQAVRHATQPEKWVAERIALLRQMGRSNQADFAMMQNLMAAKRPPSA
ncbi:tetratricopeptide repeat protein [Acidisphaera sp. L21]|uniref:tetratricopeptide repeat protein n=1 Tax=Acidisphaera sp. L21 TaxID=1641851 RepID=UPI00131C7F6F|nr:tetratricopeptide repeat protein [Acidisphaera sp. L21]